MGLSIRDWMVVVGVLLIVAVFLDGYRRVRNERRSKIRMSLNKQFLNSADPSEEFSSELPNGGARVVNRDQADDQNSQHLDHDDVPLLTDVEGNITAEAESESDAVFIPEAGISAVDAPVVSTPAVDTPLAADAGQPDDSSADYGSPGDSSAVETAVDKTVADAANQQVLVVNVMARDEGGFRGPDLLHILLACDLRFGDMNIFHRYEQSNGQGPIQFSVANVVEPGVFNLDAIDDFSTPGVCFFISLPGPEQPLQAFDYMVETAQCLVKNLDGELLDESHSVMTAQTLEHYRQHIIDSERRQLAQA